MRRYLLLTVAILTLGQTPAAADVIYSYTGNTYGSMLPDFGNPAFPDNVTGPYTLDMRITGSLVFADPVDLTGIAGPLTPLSYTFSDGVQTLTESNSRIRFDAWGDALFGLGSTWAIDIWTDPVNTFVNQIAFGVSHVGQGGDAFEQARYQGYSARIQPNPNPGRRNPGEWTTRAVPEPSTLLLAVAAISAAVRRFTRPAATAR